MEESDFGQVYFQAQETSYQASWLSVTGQSYTIKVSLNVNS